MVAPDINAASVGDMTNAVKDYSVPTERTDGASDGGPTPWYNEKYLKRKEEMRLKEIEEITIHSRFEILDLRNN